MSVGSLFQSLGPAVQNALSPRDVHFVFGTIKAIDDDVDNKKRGLL